MTQLLLTAVTPDGRYHDVSVQARTGATIGDLLEGVADNTGLRVGPGMTVAGRLARLGTDLDRAAAVGEVDLRTGDIISLSLRPATAGSARVGPPSEARLLVIGGPLAGQTFPLRPGANSIGRAPSCDVFLNDESVSRHHLTVHVGAEIVVQDAGSTNGSRLGGEPLLAATATHPDSIIEAGNSVLRIDRARAGTTPLDSGLIIFNRPPRVDRPYQGRVFELPSVPSKSPLWPIPIITAIAPLFMGAIMWKLTHNYITIVFTALSPVMLIGAAIESRRAGRKAFARATLRWRTKLKKVLDDLTAELNREVDKRRSQNPEPAAVIARSRDLLPSLYERAPDDIDFLKLRIGLADLPSLNTIKPVDDSGDDDLLDELEQMIAPYAVVPSVPATLSFVEHGSVGVSGPDEAALALARWLVLQAVTLHSPADVTVAVLAGPHGEDRWSWLKWLPHLRSVTSDLPGSPIAGSSSRVGPLLEALLDQVVARETGDTDGAPSVGHAPPSLLVILDADVELERHLLTPLFTRGPAVGIHFLWVGSRHELLPYLCGAVLHVEPHARYVDIGFSTDGSTLPRAAYEGVSAEVAATCARQLAPVTDNQWPLSRETGIPSGQPLVDLLGGPDLLIDSMEIEQRWERGVGLRAPVGVTAKGELSLDLRTDGPHGLVAGTTGSGKSEFLQSMVVGLAATHPPTRVSFVLVDYKGGAAFKACKDLPHTVGFVTDLNEHLVRRALVSLNAEVGRRERLLASASAKDLIDMERKKPEDAPPNLLIVIDEFAALAKEVPEFVDGVIDIAARGRSLGMHLILATQRPAGVVTDNIRANTNLRIALRVANGAESTDVIGSKVAAAIDGSVPGRAYVQIGRLEPLQFQAGYVGGRSDPGRRSPKIEVADFEFEGIIASDRPTESPDAAARTDLEALVEMIREAAIGLPPIRSPWLEPLAPVIDLLASPADPHDGRLTLGMADRPEEQSQESFALDLDRDGSILVYGTGGSGKSMFLRTLAVAAARAAGPDDLVLSCLDFASGSLTPLRALPQVSAVLGPTDGEQVSRLLKGIARRINVRKERFTSVGATNLVEFRRLAPTDPERTRLVVLLDGYAGFNAAFERVAGGELIDLLPRLVVDGRSVGIHFVISGDRRGAVSSALAGNISRRIVLRQSSADEYSMLGLSLRDVDPDSAPGRAMIDGVEVQLAIVGSDTSGPGLQAKLAEVGHELDARLGKRVQPLETLADDISLESLPAATDPFLPVIGVWDDSLEAATCDLSRTNFVIGGPIRSGRTTALAALATSVNRAMPTAELSLLSARRRELVHLLPWHEVGIGEDNAVELLEALAARLDAGTITEPTFLFIDDITDLIDSTGSRQDILLTKVVKASRDAPLRVVAAGESGQLRRAFGGAINEFRKERAGLLLQPDTDSDGDTFGVRLPRLPHPRFPAGRGFSVQSGTIALLQVARPAGL